MDALFWLRFYALLFNHSRNFSPRSKNPEFIMWCIRGIKGQVSLRHAGRFQSLFKGGQRSIVSVRLTRRNEKGLVD